MRSPRFAGVAVVLGLGLVSRPVSPRGAIAAAAVAADVPAQLSNQEFWILTQDLSEPNGYFRSDNVVSDELIFAAAVPDLRRTIRSGGVYVGVGPEQNFTYIAAIKPRMAFILDVRRGNFGLQLMYKALFELSADRSEFVSRLFSKPRAAGLKSSATAAELMDAYWNADTAGSGYLKNLQEIKDVLVQKHGFALSKDDLDGIAYVYHCFYWYGPSIRWSSTTSATSGSSTAGGPTYRDLMTQTNASGGGLSFLSSEEAFGVVKDLESRNAVVPVVGNFAGPKALRGIGNYVRDHQAIVAVFYVDEVEPYLRQDGIWSNFCGNAATLPIDASSVFIRPPVGGAGQGYFSPKAAENVLFPIAADVVGCR